MNVAWVVLEPGRNRLPILFEVELLKPECGETDRPVGRCSTASYKGYTRVEILKVLGKSEIFPNSYNIWRPGIRTYLADAGIHHNIESAKKVYIKNVLKVKKEIQRQFEEIEKKLITINEICNSIQDETYISPFDGETK